MTNVFSRRSVLGAGGALAGGAALGSLGTGQASARGLWQSERVRYGSKYRLVYSQDAEGNRIPDFSYAGYKYGDSPVPHVRTVKTVKPVEGDNTAHLQAAIDEVGRRPLGGTGSGVPCCLLQATTRWRAPFG